MKNIIVITTMFLLLSCSKKTVTDQNLSQALSELSESSYVELPLRPDLLRAWNRYREYGMDGVMDTTICYFMGFYSNKKDSLVSVFFNNCEGKYTGYKGMVKIDGYYVAVLDPENIGKDFYNNNLLMQKGISEFKCFKIKIVNGKVIGGRSYFLDGGVVYFISGLFFKIKNNRIEFGEGEREKDSDGDIP